ncbi:sulfurtransferase complex subunit TusB [Vibrio sp. V27_P1S3P104]|uniref:sulfurtransferase complex subunit TusB n=1 Tax=unclassified Vibrio TaxID=2614977 RepID=UPI0013730571|nr:MULTISPECIES: sulfurtransferase complex subunit TusB [unclassified Vibrio]NAW69642.1 sulfurtransferase complex subunit TusB [Vibrio sp. V28_P6S34P95]NAX06166.1 sulfurtransferase complex subunit TusB [Vibrio sp. V30_P3S12P165]NAX34184.1 sulfurtransferase complex subunit TusB [Vibrio sp. V29_P1S30P107]NAX39048.1 sulfurtransferase complex subunit TusB [Vibrio sp. V27_P1S3P104]NAX39918.1 sulfurtransferase complex subunit TusB [Vibrio sp. V26_P1S5P106]
MLHIVKKLEQLTWLSRYLQCGDVLLLVEQAVYASKISSPYYRYLPCDSTVYALQEDLAARGWLEACAEPIHIINIAGFVDMTINFEKSISW